jgi:nitrogen fixation/metabolism regulation signal transduction histidine kinase
MIASAPPDNQATNTGRHQRRARNYLLDPRFQLKYTAYLVAAALIVSAVLGVALARTSRDLIAESQRTVTQGQETVRHGQQVIDESRKVSAVVSMNIVQDPAYADNPELAALFKENASERDRALDGQQKQLKADADALTAQAGHLALQQRNIMMLLLGALSVLVLVIGLSGILFTHKIAGPIFKMKRLLQRVGEGKFQVHAGLRKGDELQHFFDSFIAMVEALRKREACSLRRIDEAIAELEPAVTADKLVALRELRKDIEASIQD